MPKRVRHNTGQEISEATLPGAVGAPAQFDMADCGC